MGQIVIPTNAKRRYILTDPTRTAKLISSLEESATRIENKPLSVEELGYNQDVRDVG